VQATLVFPQGGTAPHREALDAGLHLIAIMNNLKVEETKEDGRTFSTIKAAGDFVQVHWWTEGEHLICTIGTEKPSHTLARIEGDSPKPNLTANPLYQSTAGFNKYETILRGFVNIEPLVKMGRAVALVANPLGSLKNPYIDGTGLANLKSLQLYFGFEGKFERSTLALNVAGDRKGVMKIFSSGSKVELEQLPAIAPDVAGMTVLHIDPGTIYDVIRQMAEGFTSNKEEVADAFRKLDLALGVDVRKEVLDQLDSTIVVYNSPGEAIFGLGPGVAIRVKDPAKFKETLDTAAKSLLSVVDQDVRMDKRMYLGMEMHTIRAERRGFPFAFTFGLYKNWLIMGPYPHTVQGFVMRANGKFATWKPTALMTDVLANVQKDPNAKIISISETDPRVSLKQLASFSPFFMAIIDNTGGEFDPTLLPNYQSVTEPLFPNVTVFVDRGNALQIDTFGSLAIPFDPFGLESYWFGVFVLANIF
jgi:hypothetical protein